MIPQIKNILYATDLSQNSSYAFLYAIDMAQRHDAKIVILHAIEPIPRHLLGLKYQLKRRDDETESIKNGLQKFCEKVEAEKNSPCTELISKILVKIGYPVEEIMKTADEESCDAIVLGSHGKGFLEYAFLGSVSNGVLHRTRKPVFIIPLPSEEAGIDFGEI
jgi:nucleotide-binding universal stress UspA family protein